MTTQDERCRPSCDACELMAAERVRYFDGQLLTARDFTTEQRYHRTVARRHAAFLHDHGTVCGLKVAEHPNPACRHRYVMLRSGLAQTCCGDTIVVEDDTQIDLRTLIEEAYAARSIDLEQTEDVYIELVYQECDSEPTPSLGADCACEEHGREYARTGESYRVQVSLDPPDAGEHEPLQLELEWRHTLSVDRPTGVVADDARDRLYVTESDGDRSHLRVFDATNHSLITRIEVGAATTSGLALSALGARVYIAVPGTGIVVYDRDELETEDAPTPTHTLPVPPDLELRGVVSAPDDALFAWLGDGADGAIVRWSSEVARGEAGDPQRLQLTGSDPVDVAMSTDGRWMTVADAANDHLLVINVPQFDEATIAVPVLIAAGGGAAANNLIAASPVPHRGGVQPSPLALAFSWSGEHLYVGSHVDDAGSDVPWFTRIRVENNLAQFIPHPDDGDRYRAIPATPAGTVGTLEVRDVAVSLRDNYAYLQLRVIDDEGDPVDRGTIAVISIGDLRASPDGGVIPSGAPFIEQTVDTEGVALFEALTFLGQRLYVAGIDPTSLSQPAPGEDGIFVDDDISVLPALGPARAGRLRDEGIETVGQLAERTAEEIALIAQMPLAQAVDVLALAQGAAARPEGAVSGSLSILYVNESSCGALFDDVVDGCPTCDGSGRVVIASISQYEWNGDILEPGPGSAEANEIDNYTHRRIAASTATLKRVIECMLEKGITEGIPGRPGDVGPPGPEGPEGPEGQQGPQGEQGEQGIPGQDGQDGQDGQGLASVVTDLYNPSDQRNPVGALVGDDLVLNLARTDFTRVVNASWHLDEIIDAGVLAGQLEIGGLLLAFSRDVQSFSLNDRTVLLYARTLDERGLRCDCLVPSVISPVTDLEVEPRQVTWLVGNGPETEDVELLARAARTTDNTAPGVQIDPQFDDLVGRMLQGEVLGLTVVLRCDHIVDEEGVPIDGNNLWPGAPRRLSGNGTQGDDWISQFVIAR